MGRLSRTFANQLSDPAINGRWFCSFPFARNPERILVEAMTPPHDKLSATSRFYGGRMRFYPGVAEMDTISLIFYETKDFFITKLLNNWKHDVHDSETGNYGLPSQYQEDIVLEQFDLSNSDTPVLTSTYQECWPTDQAPFELSYIEVDGRLTVAAQFACNGVKYS